MNKNTHFIGIDISKKVFDIWSTKFEHKQFKNTPEGFAELHLFLSQKNWCVMEYTSNYYQHAVFLFENHVRVSVIIPLVIKRFLQMKLQHNKTDKSDAKMIVIYAQEQSLNLWKPLPGFIDKCKDLHTTINLYHKQSTALENKLHGFTAAGIFLRQNVFTYPKKYLEI
ncbi:IS110 family transposase [Marinifilum sp. RC60d5]|uniref:IS110 family transposase n=1 Tax=Marinifilum sp. RC60d5 TaxID=3458414 RepID=UPI004036F40F